MDVGRRQRDGDRVHARLQRGLDVADVRAAPAQNGRAQPETGDLLDDVALVAAHGRDARLDLIDPDLVEQLGDADLLLVREHDAGGLLAVAQRRVVYLHLVHAELTVHRHAERHHVLHE